MGTPAPEATFYAQRALTHARFLARTGRGSTTPAERQAAEYIQAQLASLGITNSRLQPFSGERSLWLFIALICGLALVGHAAYWLLRIPAGDLPAVALSELAFGFSAYLVWRRFTWHSYPLQSSLPHAGSQNVIAKLPPAGEVLRRVVLFAHLDSHRAVFWFATDFLVRLFIPISFITLFGIFIAGPLYLLSVLTHWQAFAWFALAIAVFHFLGWFTGLTADLGRYSPGANDNASSVATLLALSERLSMEPLQNTELWLVFTGCEETDGSGIAALVDAHGAELKDAWFINFEMVGIGDRLGYIRQEGSFARVTIPPEIESMLTEVGEQHDLHPVQLPAVGAWTDCGLLLARNFKAVCLMAARSNTRIMPEWHRLTDTPDKLQPASMERIQALAWDLLKRLDQGSAGS